MPENKFASRLQALREGGVDFILVGGLAAVLRGAPINTFDVDIVHSRIPANIDRLLRVLESLDAVSRIQPERQLKPVASHLSGPGHINLMTRYGPLDVLGTIGQNLSYEDLLPHSREMDIGATQVRVLDLETLIAIKESIGGEKDRAVLPILRRTLEEERKAGQ
jgi:predicted nucleotidyltransferase